ncbi:D-lactonohydrolase-like protein [Rhodocollybia butyracea]|uniref:D-lactonohydrolase-like protein n=1 Tax=Rhodocollybia butyracea TaxID=206335 RepID=A0A9P5UH30_9AGAR|nr:D-lactonohydrolase-like protein [Rhodocollybia butyracea]
MSSRSVLFSVVVGSLALLYAFNRPRQERIVHDKYGQVTLVNQLEFNVMGTDGNFRDTLGRQLYNPTNSTTPFFQVFDEEFLDVIGPNPSLNAIRSDPSFAFAHEAPVWVPDTDEIFYCSNAGGELGRSNIDYNNQVAKISLKEVALAMGGSPVDVNVTHYKIDLPESIQMTNGATGLYKGQIILMNEGRGHRPANLALMDPHSYQVSVLLDNFYGRQFNSLNDVKVHSSGQIFFTDVPYGYYQDFKPEPQLPNHIYSFDPRTGAIRVVADQLNKPNGLAFSKDYKFIYISDSGSLSAHFGQNLTYPATIQQYNVDPKTMALTNKRVFAYVDAGVPDGVGVDEFGNVYGACSDGVQVWNPSGKLIGKFFLGTTSANFAFAGKGRLVILAGTKIYLAQIAAGGMSLMHN